MYLSLSMSILMYSIHMEEAGLVCPATCKSVYKCIATLSSTVETQRLLKPTKLSTELLKRIINE